MTIKCINPEINESHVSKIADNIWAGKGGERRGEDEA